MAVDETCELAKKSVGVRGAVAGTPISRYIGVSRSPKVLTRVRNPM